MLDDQVLSSILSTDDLNFVFNLSVGWFSSIQIFGRFELERFQSQWMKNIRQTLGLLKSNGKKRPKG